MNAVNRYTMDDGTPAMEYTDESGDRWRWQDGRTWIEKNGTDTISVRDHAKGGMAEAVATIPYTPEALTRTALVWQAEEHKRTVEVWGVWDGAAFDAPGEWQTAESAEQLAEQYIQEARDDGAEVQIWMLEHEPECWAAWNDPNNDDPEPCHCRQFQADHRPARQWPES